MRNRIRSRARTLRAFGPPFCFGGTGETVKRQFAVGLIVFLLLASWFSVFRFVPMVHASTLCCGNTIEEPASVYWDAWWAFEYSASQSGTINSVTADVSSIGTIRIGIYNDTGSDYPMSLIVETGEWTPADTGWQTISVSNTAFTSGRIWIVIGCATSGGGQVYGDLSAQGEALKGISDSGDTYGAMPAAFPEGKGTHAYGSSIYFTYTVPVPAQLSVTLNGPSNGGRSGVTSQSFTFTPIMGTGDTFYSASLWTNCSGSWSLTASNSSALLNNTQSTIAYTFTYDTAPMTYVWNVQLFNNSASVFAPSNFTFSIISNGTWTTEDAMTYGRADITAAVYNNKIYVIGGYGTRDTDKHNDNQMYDPSTNTWTQKTVRPVSEWGMAAATVNDSIYVFGFLESDKYNCTLDSWSVIASLPTSTMAQTGLMAISVNNSLIYLFRGNQTYVYDPETDTYTVKAVAPIERSWATAALVHVSGVDRIYIIGGVDLVSGTATNANYYYNVNTDSWSSAQADAPYAAYGMPRDNPVITSTIYYCFGTYGSSFYSSLYSYNASDNLWSNAYAGASYPRDGVACGVVNNKLYVIGGRNVGPDPYGLTYNEMFSFSQNAYSVSVTVLPSSAAGTVTSNGTGPYHYGDLVVLTESPSLGYTFSGWTGDGSGTGSTRSVTVTDNMAVTATFIQNTYTLTVSVDGSGSINLNNSGPYYYGDVVELTATPTGGWSFSGWSGDLSGSQNPASITIDGHKSVTATFTQNVYLLTISYAGDGSGSVSTDRSAPYHYGDVVQLTAMPTDGSSFSGWSGDLSGSTNPTTVTIDGNKDVTATFTRNEYMLSTSIVGSGSVTRDNNEPYHYGDVVQLTAVPATGWSFSSWSGDASGSVNPVSVTIDGNKAVTAAFTQDQYALTMYTIGQGSVVPGNQTFASGTVVDIKAINAHGWTFAGWSGGASGSANTTVTMNGPVAVTATFTQNRYSLTATPVGSGSVNLNDSGPYYHGDVVELTAVPSTGWIFDHWGGDRSGSDNPTTILIDGDKMVTATFTQNVYTLAVTTAGSGSVDVNNTGPYHYGDVVQLTAVPVTGWSFQSWSGDLLGSVNPATILINGNKTVTATFTQSPYTLTVSTVGSGSVAKVPDQASYHLGDTVQLTATPTAGWSFSAWSGGFISSVNPVSVIINGTTSVTATFIQNVYTLTVATVGSGSVNLNDSGPYYYGDVVELTAVPAVSWSFDHWSGDLSGSVNPTTILINGDKAVTAMFTQNTYTLTVTTVGSGSVDLNDSGPYLYGDVVELTAAPDSGWSFSAWSGALTGSVNPADVTITGNMSVTATFTQGTYTITASVDGVGGTIDPSGTVSVNGGETITFTITPENGYHVLNVMVDGTYMGPQSSFTFYEVDRDHTITAIFAKNEYTLTIIIVGAGSVGINPNKISYSYGDVVVLTAIPNNKNIQFAYWSGDLTGNTNPATIIMDGNKTITVTFTRKPK